MERGGGVKTGLYSVRTSTAWNLKSFPALFCGERIENGKEPVRGNLVQHEVQYGGGGGVGVGLVLIFLAPYPYSVFYSPVRSVLRTAITYGTENGASPLVQTIKFY